MCVFPHVSLFSTREAPSVGNIIPIYGQWGEPNATCICVIKVIWGMCYLSWQADSLIHGFYCLLRVKQSREQRDLFQRGSGPLGITWLIHICMNLILICPVSPNWFLVQLSPFSHAGGVALWMAMSAIQSTVLVQTEISHKQLDGLPWHFAQTFMAPRGWITQTLGIVWLHLQCHHEANTSGFEWNISPTIE